MKTRPGIENKEKQRNKSLRREWTKRLHQRYEVKTRDHNTKQRERDTSHTSLDLHR
ncbi:MAG: hypothetical protein WBE34_07910 [Candidatus Nitrosopolaris sp.]